MNILHLVFFFGVISFASIPAFSAPKYGPNAQPLSAMTNTEYFQKNRAPDYWALAAYYIPQETPRGCSAANLTMILNASRASTDLTSSDELLTFKSFVEKFTDKPYQNAVYGKSLTTGENFSNKNMTRLLNLAAPKLKLPTKARATLVLVDEKDLKNSRKRFRDALRQNEKSSDDFIFFSFVQGSVTGDPEGGAHVGTIAAFDEKKGLVLVMDSDRQWYEPYWTSVDVLFDAIRDPRSDSRKEAGWIEFQAR